MKWVFLLVLALAATPAAANPSPAEAQMMRETWAKTDKPDATIHQPIFGRIISFALPRGFVIAWRQQVVGGYIAEYVPDGETLEDWTQMITVTARVGAGAARIDDDQVANVLYNKPICEGWRYANLGAVTNPGAARRRNLVIGCDTTGGKEYSKALIGAGERAAIAFFRDDETVWSVQYAERSLPTRPRALFDPATASVLLDRMKVTTCGEPDKSDDCNIESARK